MKIALLGSHSKTKFKAPYGDPDWQIWACSPANAEVLPRVDAWFEVHVPAFDPETRRADYMEFLRGLTVPLYMRDRTGHENALPYPDVEMKARFSAVPPGEVEPVPFFFQSSPAYMFAFAIAQQPEEIGLWGIHQEGQEERVRQRQSTQYFIQKAWEAGIKVRVPDGVTLLRQPPDLW